MTKIIFPLDKYKTSGLGFGELVGSGRIIGVHLGEDARASAGTEVKCIGSGKIVYAALHAGSQSKGNWGYIVIIEHKINKQQFYSLYGHLDTPNVCEGDKVKTGQIIGKIAPAYTAENGWWPAHLHFAIYTGPWKGVVLPGYYQEKTGRTRLEYWQSPTTFITNFNKISSWK